ncbi:NUDIX hydrolase domain-like protein [Amylostereum chailletii]|nr:NUDIX hydrolase domain-like protein [Amylostereum chailletii]
MLHEHRFDIPNDLLEGLTDRSRTCIQRLHDYQPELRADLSFYPLNKRAAVLVLLYERAGELRVLLTTRSKTLRAHPGQTALPGGKVDEADEDVIETACREAHEEVGLPLHSPHVHHVCILRPFLSAYKLLVTPVVTVLDDLAVLDGLKASEGEVEHIFDHPLEALLDPTIALKEPLVLIGSEHWPYDVELHSTTDVSVNWLGPYRMHRFRSSASPIKGLTSDILTTVATVAYDRQPSYDRWGPAQLTGMKAVLHVLSEDAKEVEQGVDRPLSIVSSNASSASLSSVSV